MTPAIKLALEIQVIIDSVEKGKNIPKNLLDAGYVINNKTNTKPSSSSLLRVSVQTLRDKTYYKSN